MASKMPADRFEDAEKAKWQICGVVASIGVSLSYIFRANLFAQALIAGVFGYFLSGRRYEWFYIFKKTAYRDFLGVQGLLKTVLQISWWEKRDETVASVFTKVAAKYGDKPAFYIDDRMMTFREGDEFSNRIAQYFKRQGFKRGEAVALIMETKPEYIFIWMGLAKIGVVTALINNNLRGDSLMYCVKVSNCKAIIFGDELIGAIKEIQTNPDLKGIPLYQFNMNQTPMLDNASLLSTAMLEMPADPLVVDVKAGHTKDKVLYIYTSGTTGFPKAAIITNVRYLLIPTGIHYLLRFNDNDIIYDPLPLYHTAGGVLGAGQALVRGCTVVLKKKFSASNYWKDCVKYKCTVAQYIGEICRYLLSVPPSEADKTHSVRIIMGNGLRAQIWKQFVERFNINQVGEFYGATEGNSNLINLDSRVGAIGFLTRAARFVYPLSLVRCDQATGEILRDANGRCIECGPNEPGLFLGKINPKRAILTFAGYADKTASEKKMVRNVYTEGDCYFNTGDILVMDHYGYFYFKDRTGDTFRWRGENVATTEVESVIANIVGLTDTVVFGVTIPHTEGKAGMAAIVDPQKKVNVKVLADGLKKALPAYSRPLFLRILSEAPVTSTFKLKKKELIEEGYNVERCNDDFYFLDQKSNEYIPLTKSLYDDIVRGNVRV